MHRTPLVTLPLLALLGCSVSEDDAPATGSTGSTGSTGATGVADSGFGTTQSNPDDTSSGEVTASPGDTTTGSDTGEPPADVPFESGTRLRAVVVASEDEAEVLVGWRDTELGLDCSLQPSGGDEYRCFPTQFGSILFADAKCEARAIREPCGDKPPYVRIREGDLCPLASTWTVSAWEVGDALDSIWQLDSEGNCIALDNSPGFRVSQVANELFARALPETIEVNAELSRLELTSDDGATQWLGPYITARGDACLALPVGDATECVVNSRASLSPSVHDEPTCGGLGLLQYTNLADCDPPEIAIFPDGTIVGVGGPVSPAPLYGGNNSDNCGPFPAPDTSVFASIAPAPTYPLADVAWVGEGRIRTRMVADPDGNVIAPTFPQFHDTELGFDCRPARTVSGDSACVPFQWATPGFYADDGCGEPLHRVNGDFDAIDGYYTIPAPQVECEAAAAAEVRQLGEEFEGQAYWLVGDECTPTNPEAFGLRVFTLVSPQSTDVLASLTESYEV